MKKIGILTYHRVVNIGSALQAFCLHRFLSERNPEAKVEIVDYYPETARTYNRNRSIRRNRWRVGVDWGFLKTQRILFDLLKKRCGVSRASCVSDSMDSATRFLESQGYDEVFVGSDTVFQLGSAIDHQFIAAPQPPNLYFLPNIKGMTKYGFAVSMDPYRTDQLSRTPPEVREAIMQFDAIGYRDAPCGEALATIGVAPTKTGFMPDPTVMHDFASEFAISSLAAPKRKICGIAIADMRLAKKMAQAARSLGYEPVEILFSRWDETPLTSGLPATMDAMLSLYGSFALFLTDRFHGSILSLKLSRCPVICFEIARSYPDSLSKMRDLFTRLGITQMVERYTDEDLDADWLEAKIAEWGNNSTSIDTRFDALRCDGLTTYDRLFNG